MVLPAKVLVVTEVNAVVVEALHPQEVAAAVPTAEVQRLAVPQQRPHLRRIADLEASGESMGYGVGGGISRADR